MKVRPLPAQAQRLCEELHAPERLVRHLTLVHDVAVDLVEQFAKAFPKLNFDVEAVLFGAATHDLGKILRQNELFSPGNEHEKDGPGLLESHGVEPRLARFARTHGSWKREQVQLEDLLVGLADNLWRGRRNPELEEAICSRIVEIPGVELWEATLAVDNISESITACADERLAWQASQR